MSKLNFLFFKIFVLFYVAQHVSSTLGPNDRQKKQKKIKTEAINSNKNQQQQQYQESLETESVDKNDSKLPDNSVYERDLVIKDIMSAKEIINNHNKYCGACSAKKNFDNKVLGYVTPWNSAGYDISKTFANKFDFISPVWLQIKRNGRKKYELTGTHDIDAKWMKNVRENANQSLAGVSFVPRILFENLKMEDLHSLFNDEEEITALAKMLGDKCDEFKFDGYTLEVYMQLGGYSKNDINHIVVDIANHLHSKKKLLFLVIPPPLGDLDKKNKNSDTKILFDKEDYNNLKTIVDGFSLMTYDYASHNSMIGPNAPIDWVEKNALYYIEDEEEQYKAKVFLGLNFYGMKFTLDSKGKLDKQPEPIIGSSLIDLLKKSKSVEIQYDERSEEHIIFAKEPTTLIFYPSLYSIERRLSLASELGTSISIWELGQGLDYFYDLL